MKYKDRLRRRKRRTIIIMIFILIITNIIVYRVQNTIMAKREDKIIVSNREYIEKYDDFIDWHTIYRRGRVAKDSIDDHYIKDTEYNERELLDSQLKYMISEIKDDYSKYYNKTDYIEYLDDDSIIYKNISDIGYIYIKEFKTDSYNKFTEYIEDMEDKNIEKIIIDIRGNIGGDVESAANIISSITGEKDIGYIRYKDKEELKIESDKSIIDYKKILLIDGETSNIGELLALSFKSNDIGDIVGQDTKGTGLSQSIYKLSDDTALKLSDGYLYRDKDNSMENNIVEADIYIDNPYGLDLNKEIDLDKDYQLNKAYKLLR